MSKQSGGASRDEGSGRGGVWDVLPESPTGAILRWDGQQPLDAARMCFWLAQNNLRSGLRQHGDRGSLWGYSRALTAAAYHCLSQAVLEQTAQLAELQAVSDNRPIEPALVRASHVRRSLVAARRQVRAFQHRLGSGLEAAPDVSEVELHRELSVLYTLLSNVHHAAGEASAEPYWLQAGLSPSRSPQPHPPQPHPAQPHPPQPHPPQPHPPQPRSPQKPWPTK